MINVIVQFPGLEEPTIIKSTPENNIMCEEALRAPKSPRGVDLSGAEYGKLTVLCETFPRYVRSRGTRQASRRWLCLCECEGLSVVDQSNLSSGATTSCGCVMRAYVKSGEMGRNTRTELTGRKFGRLTPQKQIGSNPPQWECLCDCGQIVEMSSKKLKRLKEPSCGCAKNLKGRSFGRWRVLKKANPKKKRPYWSCQCRCGIQRDVAERNLRGGYTLGCGKSCPYI